jgi:hypothetical protein
MGASKLQGNSLVAIGRRLPRHFVPRKDISCVTPCILIKSSVMVYVFTKSQRMTKLFKGTWIGVSMPVSSLGIKSCGEDLATYSTLYLYRPDGILGPDININDPVCTRLVQIKHYPSDLTKIGYKGNCNESSIFRY